MKNILFLIFLCFGISCYSYADEVSIAGALEHLNVLKKNRDAGIISQAYFNSHVADFAESIITGNLTSILLDDNISEKEKKKEIKKYMNGKTGYEVIDNYISPTQRIQAVSKVINSLSQVKAYENL